MVWGVWGCRGVEVWGQGSGVEEVGEPVDIRIANNAAGAVLDDVEGVAVVGQAEVEVLLDAGEDGFGRVGVDEVEPAYLLE